MGTKYSSESISGYNATAPADDGTISEANKVKWSTIKTKLPDPLKTAIENIDSKLTTHFNVGPTALITNTTLDSTHFNKVIQVSGSGVTLTLSDAATLTAGWFCDIISTDASNSVTLARTTGGNTINETSANVTILSLQELRVIVNAAANGFLVSNKARHSKAFKTAEDYTHSGTLTMSGKSVIDANASIAAHATTMDPWSLGNYVTATGTAVTFTALANAPQAGAEVEIYMNAAHIWTDNATLEVDGDANWTAEAGDRVFLRAKSTTVTTVHPVRKGGNVVVQSVISTSSTVSTDVTALPDDNTTPQKTEGDQYLSVSITPKSTTNRLFIEVLIHGFASVNNTWSAALFQDDVADALTAAKAMTTANTNVMPLYFAWEMAAGTVSSTTFKVRAGQGAGATFTFNGQAGAVWFGGVLNSYIRVTEIGR